MLALPLFSFTGANNMQTALAVLSIAGQLSAFFGAAIAAAAAFTTPEKAADVATARWASEDWRQNLDHPMAKAVLRQSRASVFGFGAVAVGTAMQILASGLML
jgi:hypothetical protein